MRPSRVLLLAVLCATAPAPSGLRAQDRVASQDQTRAREMLRRVRRDIQQNHFDSTFGGVDLDARYRRADSALAASATLPEMFAVVSQFAADLNDSHTRFWPPSQVTRVEYGIDWQMVGDSAYIVEVVPETDAAAKSLAPGDRVLGIDGMQVNRQTDRIIRFVYYRLRPRPGMRILVEKPDRSRVQLDVMSRITQGIAIDDWTSMQDRGRMFREAEAGSFAYRHRWHAFGDSVLVWRMPAFRGGDQEGIDEMLRRLLPFRAVVLDLRGNGGGAITTMLRVIGGFFDHEVLVATTRERSKLDTLVTRPPRQPYRGELMVLINSGSASASEITARTLQLQHRATIIGDRSAGAVVVSRYFPHEVGFQRVYEYATQISVMDLIMPDSSRLEGRGVIPDVEALPTPTDLASERDPAMSVPLNLVGVALNASNAAQLFRGRRRN